MKYTNLFLRYRDLGDERAWEEVLDGLRDGWRREARRRVHSADVDDVVAETIQIIYAKALSFDPSQGSGADPFASWSHGILRNVARRTQQAAQRREKVGGGSPIPCSHEPVDCDPTPAEVDSLEELREAVRAAFRELPGKYRRVLYLTLLRGLKREEVAAFLQITENAVKHLKARALVKLKALLPRHVHPSTALATLSATQVGLPTEPTTTAPTLVQVAASNRRWAVALSALVVIMTSMGIWIGSSAPGVGISAVAAAPRTDPLQAPAADQRPERLARPIASGTEPEFGCGFSGTLVLPDGRPAAGAGVRMLAWDPAQAIVSGYRRMSEKPEGVRFDVSEVHTDDQGTFKIRGAAPWAHYILVCGLGTGHGRLFVPLQSPPPDGWADLGSISLPRCRVLSGQIDGPDGSPVAGAMVCALDVTSRELRLALTQAFPFARVRPEGAALADGRVYLAPRWIRNVYEKLQLCEARTDDDGSFRISSVPQRHLLVQVSAPGFVPQVVPVGAAAPRVRVVLQRGETVAGRIVDVDGAPVRSAQTAVFPRSISGIHFGLETGATSADGRFACAGFVDRQPVFAAARANSRDPWTVVGPVAPDEDVHLELPGRAPLKLALRSAMGERLRNARVLAVPGKELGEYHAIGFAPRPTVAVPAGDGSWICPDLTLGPYILLAAADDHLMTTLRVGHDGVSVWSLSLDRSRRLEVVVEDHRGRPLPDASIYTMPDEPRLWTASMGPSVSKRLGVWHRIPKLAGTSDSTGIASIEVSGRLEWVYVFGREGAAFGKVGEDQGRIRVRLPGTGSLEGRVQTGRGTPAGGWVVQLLPVRSHPVPSASIFASVDVSGRFKLPRVVAGRYQVSFRPTPTWIDSLGSMLKLMSHDEHLRCEAGRSEIRVRAGQQNREDVVEALRAENPMKSLFVSGLITKNGSPAPGVTVRVTEARPSGVLSGLLRKRQIRSTDGLGEFGFRWLRLEHYAIAVLDEHERNVLAQTSVDGTTQFSRLAFHLEVLRVRGSLAQPPGKPVDLHFAGVVGSMTSDLRVRTDAEGRFEIAELVPGGYVVRDASRTILFEGRIDGSNAGQLVLGR